MGQINAHLRSVQGGHGHWCPGCQEMHVIPNSWSFDGNLDAPTFNPSVLITGKKRRMEGGKWIGEGVDAWERNPDGSPKDQRCHYFLHGGILKFCGDSLHALAGSEVPLPELPSGLED